MLGRKEAWKEVVGRPLTEAWIVSDQVLAADHLTLDRKRSLVHARQRLGKTRHLEGEQ